jgi:hypothetical protein
VLATGPSLTTTDRPACSPVTTRLTMDLLFLLLLDDDVHETAGTLFGKAKCIVEMLEIEDLMIEYREVE